MEEGGKKERKEEDEAQKKAMEEGGGEDEAPKGPMEEEGGDGEGEEEEEGGGAGGDEAPKGPMEEEGGDGEGEEEGGGGDEAPKGPMEEEEEGGDGEGEEEGGGAGGDEAPKGPMEEEGGDGEGEQEEGGGDQVPIGPMEEEGGDGEGEQEGGGEENEGPLSLPMEEWRKRKGTMELNSGDVKRRKMDGEGERKRHIYQLNQPFSDEIMREILPENFRHSHNLPKFVDFSNPEHHLNEYLAYTSLQNLSNGICCKLFLTTLSSTALSLFYKLPPKSIHNFQDLADAFVNDFAFNAKFHPTTIDKLKITQSRHRSVEDYISDVMEKVHGLAVRPQFREILTLIINGLRDGLFKSFITRFPPNNLHELWGLANGLTEKERETYDDKKSESGDDDDDESDG